MKRVPLLVAGLALTASTLLPLASAPPAHAATVPDEAAFVAAVNGQRAARGLAPVAVDVRLTNIARGWAGQMAAMGRLADNPNLAAVMPPGWTMIGENVGMGPSEAVIESALEHDAPHLANMVQPAFSAIGVGVVAAGGQLWMAEDLMAGVPVVSPAPPPPPAPTPRFGWTGWRIEAPGPPGMIGGPAVTTWGPGRFDEFVRGGDNQLWHRVSLDGGVSYTGWVSVGAPPGGLRSSPAAVSWGPGRIDVFALGADRAVWHLFWQGRWVGWEDLGGSARSAPAVSSWSPGRLDVFVVLDDRSMWHRPFDNGTWYGWDNRGGSCVFAPAATSWAPNRIDLFTVGSDGLLWHQWWDGQQWSTWKPVFPGTWSAGPGAAAWAPGRLDITIPSSAAGHPLTHFAWNGTLHVDSLAGTIASAPSVTTWAPGRLDVFVRGGDGRIYHNAYF